MENRSVYEFTNDIYYRCETIIQARRIYRLIFRLLTQTDNADKYTLMKKNLSLYECTLYRLYKKPRKVHLYSPDLNKERTEVTRVSDYDILGYVRAQYPAEWVIINMEGKNEE